MSLAGQLIYQGARALYNLFPRSISKSFAGDLEHRCQFNSHSRRAIFLRAVCSALRSSRQPLWHWRFKQAILLQDATAADNPVLTGSDGVITNANFNATTSLPGNLSIHVGLNHVCTITSTNTVVCWGDQSGGKLGNGTSAAAFIFDPVAVTGLTNVTALGGGRFFYLRH